MNLSDFFGAWELFREAALAGAAAGALLGVLGVYVVLRRMVFLTAAVSHAAGLGVAGAFYLQVVLGSSSLLLSPTLGALVMTLLTLGGVALTRTGQADRSDAALGFAYLVGAAGTLALGTRIVQELHDINTLLYGTAVAVLPGDFRLLVSLTAALLLIQLWWWRGFMAVSFDRPAAAVRGLPVSLIEGALMLSLAVSISVCTQILGALPTFAFSVLPAMAATRLASNVPRALVIAGLVGAASGFIGYLVAFLHELPVGASQALVAAGLVVAVEVVWRAREAVGGARGRRAAASAGQGTSTPD